MIAPGSVAGNVSLNSESRLLIFDALICGDWLKPALSRMLHQMDMMIFRMVWV
jgi:hypothetical protein